MSRVIAKPDPGRFTFRICVFLFAATCLAYASARAEERIALVIGNSHYQELGTLNNAKADATSIAALLKGIGYKTTLVQEASELGLRKAVRSFAAESASASIAVVYYAGHGAQVNGENFLLPGPVKVELTPLLDRPCQLSFFQLTSSLPQTLAYGGKPGDSYADQQHPLEHKKKP